MKNPGDPKTCQGERIRRDLGNIFCDIIDTFSDKVEHNNFTYRHHYWSTVFGDIFRRKRFSIPDDIFLKIYEKRTETVAKKFSPEIREQILKKWESHFYRYYCVHYHSINNWRNDPGMNSTIFLNHMMYTLKNTKHPDRVNRHLYYKTCIDTFIKFYTKWIFCGDPENLERINTGIVLMGKLCDHGYGEILTDQNGVVISILTGDLYPEDIPEKDYVVLRVLLENTLLVDLYIHMTKHDLYEMVKKRIPIGHPVHFDQLILNEEKTCLDYLYPCPLRVVRSWKNMIL